jgi:hypothetical protein
MPGTAMSLFSITSQRFDTMSKRCVESMDRGAPAGIFLSVHRRQGGSCALKTVGNLAKPNTTATKIPRDERSLRAHWRRQESRRT